jgi:hypothetical protein
LKEGITINLILKKVCFLNYMSTSQRSCWNLPWSLKIDFVIQRITSSSSRRSESETWAKKLDYTGPNLIDGYGIWWNIKFQSCDCVYKAQTVINKMIDNEKDWQEREGGNNFYNNHVISQSNWEVVNKLNDIIGVSDYLDSSWVRQKSNHLILSSVLPSNFTF